MPCSGCSALPIKKNLIIWGDLEVYVTLSLYTLNLHLQPEQLKGIISEN